MRSTLLTTAAIAALFALPPPASAQDRYPDRQQQQAPAATESGQAPGTRHAPMQQEKATGAEHSGRSAAEPSSSGAEVQGKGQNRGENEELKSKNKSSQRSEQGAEEQKPELGQTRKPSAATEPMRPGEEKMRSQAEKKQRHGESRTNPAATETERAPSHTMRSNAPAASESGKEMQKPSGRVTGGNEAPSKAPPGGPATGRSATPAPGKEHMQGGAMATQGNEQRQGGAVTLNSRQQADVFAALSNEPVQSLDNIDIALTAGTIIPAYVALNPLPESVVAIVLQYSGYDFVMVRNEILIVEPQTRRIVTAISGHGRSAWHGQGRSAATAANTHLRLTGRQRLVIMSDLRTSESASIGRVYIGARVPEDVELLSIPQNIVSEIPVISPYSYFITGNEVVLVAPDTREVVDIVR